MLAQTCPLTTLAVVNVDAVGRPAAPGVHGGRGQARLSQNREGHVPIDNVDSGQRRCGRAPSGARVGPSGSIGSRSAGVVVSGCGADGPASTLTNASANMSVDNVGSGQR